MDAFLLCEEIREKYEYHHNVKKKWAAPLSLMGPRLSTGKDQKLP